MKRIRAVLLLLAISSCLGLSSLAVLGCERREEGPLEKAGEALEETGEEIKDEVDDAT